MSGYTGRAHDLVLDLLGALPRGRVLDIPCATGRLALRVRELGFTPVCADITRGVFEPADVEFVAADMNRALPFRDGEFDHVLCVEGVEHMESTHHLARELARVLKPGGSLLLTTPNLMSFKARWMFLFYSRFPRFDEFGSVAVGRRHGHGHINPVFWPHLRVVLEQNGFRDLRVTASRHGSYRRFFSWLLRPAIRWCTSRGHPMAGELLRPELLLGENLVVHAVKAGPRSETGR